MKRKALCISLALALMGCSVAPASSDYSSPVATELPSIPASATVNDKVSSQPATPSPVQTPAAAIATEYTPPGGAAGENPALPAVKAAEITDFTLSRAGVTVFTTNVGPRCTVSDCIPDTGIAQEKAGELPQVPSARSVYLIGHSFKRATSDPQYPFSQLQQAKFGDKIVLETAAGSFTYSVGMIQHVAYNDFPTKYMSTFDPYRLVAMACEYSPDKTTYVGVFVVFANLELATPKG